MPTPRNGLVTGLTPEQRRARMDGAFGRLASMQLGNGHFSMWGNDDNADPQLTPYIVDFLLDARQAGFAVPDDGVLQKALQRLNEDLLSGGSGFYGRDHREYLQFAYKAYAGYVSPGSIARRWAPCAACTTTIANMR